MGCCGGNAEWKREEVLDHKFDFIDVREYRDTGMLTQLKYTFLYANMAKSVAVYLADIYTAITLIVLGHLTGSVYSEVQNGKDASSPLSVSVEYTRWIFTGCIIFSFLLLAYEAHKARAIVRSRDISYAYTNVMANNWYSLNSYDHFCFFQQINNSKKKKDEFAFFIFFTFKGWKRLLVADGPRQVINAFFLFTLASNLDFTSDVYQYYKGNVLTAIMLLTMIFTVVVFAASAFLLAVAALMYIPLIMYIKGNLKEYCCHKIDKRISELVRRKKKSRAVRQAALARKEAEGDFSHLRNKKGELVRRAIPQPTLPNVEVDLYSDSGSTINNVTGKSGVANSTTPGYAGSILGQQQQQQQQPYEYGSEGKMSHVVSVSLADNDYYGTANGAHVPHAPGVYLHDQDQGSIALAQQLQPYDSGTDGKGGYATSAAAAGDSSDYYGGGEHPNQHTGAIYIQDQDQYQYQQQQQHHHHGAGYPMSAADNDYYGMHANGQAHGQDGGVYAQDQDQHAWYYAQQPEQQQQQQQYQHQHQPSVQLQDPQQAQPYQHQHQPSVQLQDPQQAQPYQHQHQGSRQY